MQSGSNRDRYSLGIYLNISASKCTVLSVFYTESRVKIRSTERPVKNTEVVGSESVGVRVRF